MAIEMTTEKMFEKAMRKHVTFNFRGQISTEDLWDLSVEHLDSIYKGLKSKLKQASEESLLQEVTPEDEALNLQIEIVTYIVRTKQAEAAARLQAKEISAEEQEYLALLKKKQQQQKEELTEEQIQAKLDELRAQKTVL